MAVRTVALITIGVLLGIAALVLHLLAMCSPQWKITKRQIEPITAPVSYGLWEKCEYTNFTVIKQGMTIGTLPNTQFCYPNRYMKYSLESYQLCHNQRRNCPVLDKHKIPEGCSCRYLPSTKALQWLTFLASICLVLGLILLYLKTITAPENTSAAFLLDYGPFICFLLTFLLMLTGLIVFGAYFRRDTYEDFSFPLNTVQYKNSQETYNLHNLHVYAKSDGGKLNQEQLFNAEKELITEVNHHFSTVIGRGTVYEIIATVLVLFNTVLTALLLLLARSENNI